ncbi:MAG: C69 family dipeptidase [Deltaproteobacteria bacterium]|nr:C69 family dipeptidase [Deltaproteobacteria bacterium]
MCDTFVALKSATADGSVIFGKNSDREPNEAMALEFVAGGTHGPDELVHCTSVAIPQAPLTFDILICRPFWMWGAEMGANENGLVIGNEAVFTRMPVNRGKALTGMDLLRLALERAGSAEQAVEVIVGLLADHGQGGICGYTDRRMAYHNSFLCADPYDAWILETSGELWAAKRITDSWAISNRLTLDDDFDRSHPQLIDTARHKGWLKPGRTFSFKRCYSDWFNTTFSFSAARQNRCRQQLAALPPAVSGKLDFAGALRSLRDHATTGYRPAAHLFMDRICMHAANPVSRGFQTTGSLVAHLTPHAPTYWATGTSAPCTGIFKPMRFEMHGMPDTGTAPGAAYDERSLWWRHERLHRLILMDYGNRLSAFADARDGLERSFVEESTKTAGEENTTLCRKAFKQAEELTRTWVERVDAMPVESPPGWAYRRYWQALNKKAGVPVSGR